LQTDTQEVYTRVDVAELFIIGRSRAADLMKVAGAEVRNGTEATVSRSNLRYYVERCPEAKAFLAEQERRDKLARQLKQTAEELRLREIQVPADLRDTWTRFKDLPNVELAPTRLCITFHGTAELLRTLMRVAQAMANEFERFVEICDPAVPPPPPDHSGDFPDFHQNGILG
jgi:hypothetical protein